MRIYFKIGVFVCFCKKNCVVYHDQGHDQGHVHDQGRVRAWDRAQRP